MIHRKARSGALVLLSVASLTIGIATASHSPKLRAASASKPTFTRVETILKASCVGCHNQSNHPENVDLASYGSVMHSGGHRPIVVAGHPEKSSLLTYIDGEKQPRMPFQRPPLAKGDVDIIRGWIKAGAKP